MTYPIGAGGIPIPSLKGGARDKYALAPIIPDRETNGSQEITE